MIAAILLLSAWAAFQDPSIEALIRQLHSENLEERERASAGLLKLGSKANAALEEVAAGSDAEAAARARAVLHRIWIQRLARPVVAGVDNPFGAFGRADHFQITADAKTAVGCDLEGVYAWTVPDGRLIRTWRAHRRHIAEATLSPDGTRLVTLGDLSQELKLWEFPSGRLLKSFVSPSRSPRQVVVAPGGEWLAIANGSIEWVEAATGRVAWSWFSNSPGGDFTVDVSRDGRTLAVGSFNSPRLSMLNSKGELVRKLELRTNSLGSETRVYFTDDGAGVVIDNFQTGSRLLDSTTGEIKTKASLADRYSTRGKKARFIVMAPRDRPVEGEHHRLQLEKQDSLVSVVLSPDERYVLVQTLNGRSITCFDLAKNDERSQIGTDVSCFAVDERGVLTGTRTGSVMLYGFDGKELKRVAHGHSEITSVAFAGGTRIVAQGRDLAFRCLDLETGRELWRREYFRFKQGPVRFHPDGKRAFAVFDGPNQTVEFSSWNLETGTLLRKYGSCAGFMRACAVSRDGSRVAVSGRGGYVGVWDVESGKPLYGEPSGWMVNDFVFAPDGSSLYFAGEDGRIERRSLSGGKTEVVFEEHGPRILSFELNAAGTYLAAVGDKGPVAVYDVKTGRRVLLAEAGYPVQFTGETKLITPFAGISALTGDVRRHPPMVPAYKSCIDDTRTRIAVASIHTNRVSVGDVEGKGFVWGVTTRFLPDLLFLGAQGGRAVVALNSEGGQFVGFAVGSSVDSEWQGSGWLSGCDSSRGLLYLHKNDGMQTIDMATGLPRDVLKGSIDGPIRVPPGSPVAFGVRENIIQVLDPATLKPIRTVPDAQNVDVLDCNADGTLFLDGWNLLDAATGKFAARIEPDLSFLSSESGVARTFFGKDGKTILALTVNGLVITLNPGE